jgi:hypothetical protein
MNFLDLYNKRSQLADWYHQKDQWFIPNTEWPDLDFKLIKLPAKYSFDLQRMISDIEQVAKAHPFIHREEKYKNTKYSGISLTTRGVSDDPMDDWWSRVDESGNPLVDHSQQLFEGKICLSYEDGYQSNTPAMTQYIDEIISRFNSKITRVALMRVQGQGAITPHVDFPYYHCIRLHACISGGANTFLEVDKETFQIPEDGNFYMLDAGKTHGVINTGDANRINLNVNLIVPLDLLRTHGLRKIIEEGLL